MMRIKGTIISAALAMILSFMLGVTAEAAPISTDTALPVAKGD